MNGDKAYPNTVFHAGHGVWMEVYPDGADRLAVQIASGFAQGPFRRHHAGGKLAEKGAFVDGLPDGLWVRYDPAGKELGRFTLTRGNGTITEWEDNGEIDRVVDVKNGTLHGWDLNFMRGRVIWATCNRDGLQVSKTRIDDEAALTALKAASPCP